MIRLASSALAALFVAGCANVHHIEVGAVPTDYRTQHPIVVSEGETVLEIPVTAHDTRLTLGSSSRIDEFADRFRHSRSAAIRLMVPVGSLNEQAARLAAVDAVSRLRARGVPHDRIVISSYASGGVSGPVPLRLAYSSLQASVAPCGRWPEDLAATHDNRNYFNFGCASQANLAAQIADPQDLLTPRGRSEIDAARRTTSLGRYRAGQALPTSGEVNY
jgi:pilus assembly protein CpaD